MKIGYIPCRVIVEGRPREHMAWLYDMDRPRSPGHRDPSMWFHPLGPTDTYRGISMLLRAMEKNGYVAVVQ